MNFKDLKKDFPLYVLDRNGDMEIVTAKVLSDVSAPHIDYEHGNSMQMVVDVNLEIGGKSQIYVMPEGISTTTTPNNMVISTDITTILRELDSMRVRSEEVVRSCPVHQHIIERCNDLMEQWDPVLKERRESNKRFETLESRISTMEGNIDAKFDKIMQTLSIKNQ